MRRERGMALIIALLAVAAVAVLTLAMADRGRRVATDTVRDRAEATALAAARGGVERARWALARDGDYAGETLTIGDAVVVVEISRDDGEVGVRSRATTSGAPFADRVAGTVDARFVLRDRALPAVVEWAE